MASIAIERLDQLENNIANATEVATAIIADDATGMARLHPIFVRTAQPENTLDMMPEK